MTIDRYLNQISPHCRAGCRTPRSDLHQSQWAFSEILGFMTAVSGNSQDHTTGTRKVKREKEPQSAASQPSITAAIQIGP
jgi:hypothetical protein